MSESDLHGAEGTWQEPARWSKRRLLRILTFVAVVALAVVAYEKLTEKNAHLTAVDRASGAQRWKDTLPVAGAAVIWQQNDLLGIGACGGADGGETLVVDPSTGKMLQDRDWRSADGDPALVSVWIDTATIADPFPLPEFSYDRGTGSLVSAKGWAIRVHVSGYPRHIPILVIGDSVYFIENAIGCGPGTGGGG